MACGIYELEGQDIYVQLFETETGPVEERKPEAHRKYIDVQYLVTGAEVIGCTPDTGSYTVSEDLLAERDLLFYQGVENETFIRMTPGWLTVLFPSDIHRPACMAETGPQIVRKAVVKVAMSLL